MASGSGGGGCGVAAADDVGALDRGVEGRALAGRAVGAATGGASGAPHAELTSIMAKKALIRTMMCRSMALPPQFPTVPQDADADTTRQLK